MRPDLYSELYNLEKDYWWHVGKRQITFDLIKTYVTGSKEDALDIGCGAGLAVEELGKVFNKVSGLDVSPEALSFCRKRGLNNLVLSSVDNINSPDRSFDLITAFDVLEHVDDQKALQECHRILRPSGIIIVTVPAYQSLWSYWDEMLGHKRRYNIKSLGTILENSGFKIIKISHSNFFILLPVLIVRTFKKLSTKSQSQSDFITTPKFLSKILKKVYLLESFIINKASLPAGLSVVAVAKKP